MAAELQKTGWEKENGRMKIRNLNCPINEAEQHLAPDELAGLKSGRYAIASFGGNVWLESTQTRIERTFTGQIVIPESYKWGANG